MRKFKVALMALLAVAIALTALSACGGDDPPPVDKAVLESITVTAPPAKTEYKAGEKFDKTGMVVTASYSDKTTKKVSSYTVSPAVALRATDTSVTISFTDGEVTKTAPQKITVSEADPPPPVEVTLTGLNISSPPEKMTYNLGEEFDPTGLAVEAVYSDTTKKQVTDITVEPSGMLGVNDTAVKATYTEDGKSVSAYYNKKILIEAPELPASAYTVAAEISFADASNYTLAGGAGKATWSSDGNTFDRLRCWNKEGASITLSHDFSALTDKSKAGFLAIMSNARGGTKISVSTDDQATWQTVAEAGEGMNTIPADYKYPSKEINGKAATDGSNRNVFYCYYELGKYLQADTGIVFLRFAYEDPKDKGWVGPDVEGADLIHSLTFYDWLDLSKASGEVSLQSLSVKMAPTKTVYTAGESFDPVGLVLEAEYSDGSKHDVTMGYTFSPDGALIAGTNKVVVSYTDGGVTETADVAVTVNAPAAQLSRIEVTAPPDKTAYAEGETFDKAGMAVTAYFDDGSSIEVTDYSVTPDGALGSDVTAVTIAYQGKETAQAITVRQSALKEADYDVAAKLLFTDAGNYTLKNNAYLGADRQFADGTTAKRLRAGDRTGAYILFEYDFAAVTDRSQAGLMIYALDSRMGTVVSVSTDNETFTPIAKVSEGDKRVPADWKEHADDILGGGKPDANLFRLYYNVGSYLDSATKLYVRIGYEDPGWASYPAGTSKEGADIFGAVTFYSRLDLSKVV